MDGGNYPLPDMPVKNRPSAKSGDLPDMPKKDSGAGSPRDFGMGYKPTVADLKTKQGFADLENGFDKSQNGTTAAQNNALQDYWKHLNPKERQTISETTQKSMALHKGEHLQDATEENNHYKFMQSPVGKVVGATKYLASQATHGGLQVVKGVSHLLTLATNLEHGQLDDKNEYADKAFAKADDLADMGLTKGDIERIQNEPGLYNKALSASGMAANFAPTILGGEALQSPKALLYLQGLGQGKEIAEKMPDLHPIAKEALIQGSGAVNLILSDLGDKMFGEMPASLKKDVSTGVAAKVIEESAGKDMSMSEFNDALKNESKTALEKLQTGGIKAAESYADNIKTFAKLKGATFLMHKGVDVINDAEGGQGQFNETPGKLAEGLSDVPAEALPFSVLPAYRSIMHEFIDPVNNQKEQLETQIRDLSSQITKTDDPVEALHNEVKQEKLDELNKEYKQLITKQNEKEENNGREQVAARTGISSDSGSQSGENQETHAQPDREVVVGQEKGQKEDVGTSGEGKTEPELTKQEGGKEDAAGGTNLINQDADSESRNKKTIEENAKIAHSAIASDAITALSNGRKKQVVVIGEDGKPVVEEHDFDKEDADLELDRLEALAKKGKLTKENFQSSYFGQATSSNTLKGAFLAIEQDPEGFISRLRNSYDNINETTENNIGGNTEGQEAAQKSEEKTGIRNEDVEKERQQKVDREHRSIKEIDAEGKRMVQEGELDPDEFAKKVAKGGQAVTAEQEAALLYRKQQLKNRQNAILYDEDPNNHADNQIEYAKNEELLEQNRKATEMAGNISGRSLRFRQELMKEDYSLETMLRRAKMANGGVDVPDDVKAELKLRSERIEQLQKDLSDREDKIRKLQDENTIGRVKTSSEFEARQARRETTKASLRKEREGLLADLHIIAKKSLSSLGANKIPVDMIVPLSKLARNYVLDGITTISGVADKIFTDLKDHLPGISKEDIENSIKDGFDKYLSEQNALRLGTAKKRQATELEKLKSGNYEKKVYKKILVDNDYLRIRAEINREQQKFNKKIADIENSQKSLNRKIVDAAVRYGRAAKLASVTVLGKLTAAGLSTIGIKPITEGTGKFWSAFLPKVSAKSKVEGSVTSDEMRRASEETGSVNSIAGAYARAFTIGMKDAWQELTQGGSDLSQLYKDNKAKLPAEALDFFGHLHSAIKAPVKRFAWELSYAKRAAKNIRDGLDPLDPVIDAQNRLNAYKDGEKAIFMGDNELSQRYENAVGGMEKSRSSIVRTTAAAMRILLPFVKVPSNIALEGAKYGGGLVSGTARLARAFSKGMDNLEPEEADIILEHLKKGSIGGAALLAGFFNPQAFGGFYQQGVESKNKPLSINIAGEEIPAFLVEHPIFLAAQIGASFRQLLELNEKKDDNIPIAMYATLTGLGSQVPQAAEIKRLTDLGSAHSVAGLKTFASQTAKGEFEPAFLQQLAQITDTKDGSAVSLNPKNQQQRVVDKKHGFLKQTGEEMESGLPWLRKNLAKKGENTNKLLPK